jgi:pimeloyl-ACP methyl ester carboxylesterase
MKHIYLLSGLGVDERVFQYLDLSEYHITYIKWVPHDKQDSLKDYAKKLTDQIKTSKPILIGLSFGGMVAIEISKIIETDRIILISSAKMRRELPLYFRLSAYLRLHRIMPADFMKQSNPVLNWLFGTTNTMEVELLTNILRDTDAIFLKWAIDKIITWNNVTVPSNLEHIHGTEDRILPYSLLKADFPIKNGGHFMIVNKAAEVNAILLDILNR